jgi:hypothetical protein
MLNAIDATLEKDGCCIISEGTLRRQDTIPRMLSALRELSWEAYQQAQIPGCGFPMVPDHALEDDEAEWWTSEDCSSVWDILFEALNEHCCIGYEFGAHPDDPACLGFWRTEE